MEKSLKSVFYRNTAVQIQAFILKAPLMSGWFPAGGGVCDGGGVCQCACVSVYTAVKSSCVLPAAVMAASVRRCRSPSISTAPTTNESWKTHTLQLKRWRPTISRRRSVSFSHLLLRVGCSDRGVKGHVFYTVVLKELRWRPAQVSFKGVS